MKEFFTHMYRRKHFVPRLISVILSTIVMGFAMSWLVLVDFGTDPSTMMNLAVSKTLGIGVGDWQALMNTVLLVIVLFFGVRNLGFGTLANMFVVGYSLQFFSWLWGIVLPAGLFDSMAVRIGVLIPALTIFVFAVGVYIEMDLGTSPYDAIPLIAARYFPKVPFRFVRICFDAGITVIGLIFGGKLGVINVAMVFTIGPVIDLVGVLLRKFIEIDD